MPEIRAEGLRFVYSRGTPFEKVAIDNLDLTVSSGEYVALLGHTGSGKSTLVQQLNGLLRPAEGRILLDGEDIHTDKKTLRAARFRVGLVFQYPEYQLFEETVRADIAFGPRNMGLTGAELDEHVRLGADFAGVDEALFDQSPLELSGGQKRRVAIAGVLAMQPGVLVLDEPTAGLDPAGCRDILQNISRYRRETGATIILVTHDMSIAAQAAERLLVLDWGRLVMDGTPQEVFSHAQELRGMGLDIPMCAELALRLRELGIPVRTDVASPAELAEALSALKGGCASC